MAEAGDAARTATRPLLARSPIPQAAPVEASGGWEVSTRRSDAPLRLADVTPLTKVLVRAGRGRAGQPPFDAPSGRATRAAGGALVVGSRPGEWTVVGAPEAVRARVDEARAGGDDAEPTVVDVTHGLALMRLTGDRAPAVLATLCAIDLGEGTTPDGAAFTSSVAKVTTEVVRDDAAGERSYLLATDRGYGQYLFEMVRDAGRAHGLEVEGFPGWR